VNLVRQTRRTLKVDGIVGNRTLDAINRMGKADTLRLLSVLNGVQFMYYVYRTDQMDDIFKIFRTFALLSQKTFFRGWMKRIKFDAES
jgi:lysozyme family protein